MSDFFNQKLSKNTKKCIILGVKVQIFSGGGPPDPPLIGRLRLLFCRLAKIPAENPDPHNVWFFWVSRHRSIILAKKNGNIFRQILRNSRKCVKTWIIEMLIDHKNTSVFFQAVSGKSSWSYSYRWTQYQWEKKKTATRHQFIALLAREEKIKDVFSAIFSFECPFSTPL